MVDSLVDMTVATTVEMSAKKMVETRAEQKENSSVAMTVEMSVEH